MLTSFHIKNFRSCKDVKFDGMGPMLGLVGRNGAGKTTILRAIEWAASLALAPEEFSLAFLKVGGSASELHAAVEVNAEGYEYRYTVGNVPRRTERGLHTVVPEERLFVRPQGKTDWSEQLVRSDASLSLVEREQQILINHGIAMMPALTSLLPEADPLQEHSIVA